MGDGLLADITVLDPLEHSGVGVRVEMVSAYLPRVHSEDPRNGGGGPRDYRGEDNTLPDPLKKVERGQPEDGEAIVVGVVGSAASWFLTGWANDMEVELMTLGSAALPFRWRLWGCGGPYWTLYI